NVRNDINAVLGGPPCTDVTRQAIRLAAADALTFSTSAGNGGADGSVIRFYSETNRLENTGLLPLAQALLVIANTWSVSAADVIQLASILSVGMCIPGPSIPITVGRIDAITPNPEGRLSSPTDTTDAIIARYEDIGFTPKEMVALLGAHSSAKNRFFIPKAFGYPLDSTVDHLDNQYYIDILQPFPPPLTLRLPSDVALSQDPRTAPFFKQYALSLPLWQQDFAAAMFKMSQLGVGQ
ncbi:heme peroxidase, partial [Blyttiomyces helicus]